MRIYLSRDDVSEILTSLHYSKNAVGDSPSYQHEPDGYKIKVKRLDELSAIENKLRAARDKSRQSTQ